MGNPAEIERAWQRMREIDRAIAAEMPLVRKNGGPTKAYTKLKKDAVKAREEYEKLKGGGMVDPLNPDKGDAFTRNKVLRAFLGKEGPDSHSKMEY
jgi:hypothetical protein